VGENSENAGGGQPATADDGDTTVTHWCGAHRLSLLCKLAFMLLKTDGRRQQLRRVKPPEQNWSDAMKHMNELMKTLVNYFDNVSNYDELRSIARNMPAPDASAAAGQGAPARKPRPWTMNRPTETRFHSNADLYLAVHHNIQFFREMVERDGKEGYQGPEPVKNLWKAHNIGESVFFPYRELNKLKSILEPLMWLCKEAEADDADTCTFEWRLTTFVAGLEGKRPFIWYPDPQQRDNPRSITVEDCSRDSVIVPGLVENLKLAFGHYFDRELETDWAALLCIILHPTSSGCPAAAFGTEEFKIWPCLRQRFQNCWRKSGGGERVQDAPNERVINVMRNGEKVLREELELQYEIDHSTPEVNPEDLGDTSARTTSSAKRPKLKEFFDSDDDDEGDAEMTDIPSTSKEVAVKRALDWWLSRKPDKAQTPMPSMLSAFGCTRATLGSRVLWVCCAGWRSALVA